MDEFVPFFLKVGECILEVNKFFISPTSFFRFSVFTDLLCLFHLVADFNYSQIESTCTCLALWLALSVFVYMSFSLTVSFRLLCHTNQFSPTMLCALVSATCISHLVDFTYLQISTCTCLVDWCCFYYFVQNSQVALLEPLFARVSWLALSVLSALEWRMRARVWPLRMCARVWPLCHMNDGYAQKFDLFLRTRATLLWGTDMCKYYPDAHNLHDGCVQPP